MVQFKNNSEIIIKKTEDKTVDLSPCIDKHLEEFGVSCKDTVSK